MIALYRELVTALIGVGAAVMVLEIGVNALLRSVTASDPGGGGHE